MVDQDYQKKYYQANKQKAKEYYKQVIECEQCGCKFVRSNKFNHQRTKKHLRSLENKVTIKHFEYDTMLDNLNKKCDEILFKIEKM